MESEVIAINKLHTYVGRSSKGYGFTYFARMDFPPGVLVMAGFGRVTLRQTKKLSMQIGPGRHFVPTKWSGRYWNHSCNPNTYVETRSDGFPNLVALRTIRRGDEITFAYWMSELSWCAEALESTIGCQCDERVCKGRILSWSQLPKSEKLRWKRLGRCSAYLLEME